MEKIPFTTEGTVTFLPHRLNRQPVVVRGLTADELWISAGLSGAFGLIVGIFLTLLFGQIALIPTTILLSIALGIFIGGGFLQRQKRGKPETWLYRQIQYQMQCHYPTLGGLIGGSHLTTRTGFWSIKRSVHEPI